MTAAGAGPLGADDADLAGAAGAGRMPPPAVPAPRRRPVRLARPRGGTATFAVAPLVDVLLILLVFFLVSSTYLDLDMIPMVRTEDDATAAAADPAPAPSAAAAQPGALLVRLDADGRTWLRGEALAAAALSAALSARLGARPGTTVLILPSPRAPAQALVDALGAAAQGGARAVRVVRIAEAGAP